MGTEDPELTKMVKARAGHYLPDAGSAPIHVRHAGSTVRHWSRIDRYRLHRGDATLAILVKRAVDTEPEFDHRQDEGRLVPRVDTVSNMRHEYDALRLIASSLGTVDRTIGVVPVLDRLDDGGIVMGEVVGEPLSGLLARSARILSGQRTVDFQLVLSSAGLWLRRFQALSGPAELGQRLEHRDQVIDAIHRLAHYLKRHGERAQLLEAIAEHGTVAAKKVLPETLPLGLAHGDFAPRNLLVTREGRVIVTDTRARWRAPVWEDVATMLVSLRASPLRSLHRVSFSVGGVARLERAFLEGRYEGEQIPRPQIRIFELLILLDRWAARRPVGSTSRVRRARMLLVRGQYARLAAQLLPALERD